MSKGWRFETTELKYVSEVLNNGFGASETGAFTERLEKAFAHKHNQKYGIGYFYVTCCFRSIWCRTW